MLFLPLYKQLSQFYLQHYQQSYIPHFSQPRFLTDTYQVDETAR